MIMNLSEDIRKNICECLSNAIINTNVDLDGRCTQNSRPSFFWDNLNTELTSNVDGFKNLNELDQYIVKRGPWGFLILYKDGVIYTFMRKQRLEQLRKDLEKNRANHHYAVNLARVLNINIPEKEEALFEECYTVLDADKENVDKLLRQIIEEHSVIKNYVVVLFDADKTALYDVHMVVLNGRLEVCEKENLSQYIQITESVVVESTKDEPDESVDAPNIRLKFKSKAHQKKANKMLKIRTPDNDISKEGQDDTRK